MLENLINFVTKVNVNTVVIGIFGIVLAYNQYRSTQNKIDASTITAYKEQLGITEKKLKDNQETMQNMNKQIGVIQGKMAEKDKQLADYKVIFQGRDPKIGEILGKVVEFMVKLDERFQTVERAVAKPVSVETKITKN